MNKLYKYKKHHFLIIFSKIAYLHQISALSPCSNAQQYEKLASRGDQVARRQNSHIYAAKCPIWPVGSRQDWNGRTSIQWE